ncbi:MAG: hypothetical protein WAP74_04055 [Patescibacteria group bacterium]
MPKLTGSEIDTLIGTLKTELENYNLGLGDVSLVTSWLSDKLGQRVVQLIRELRAELDEQFLNVLREQASRLCSIGGHCNARLSASDYSQSLEDAITTLQYNFSAQQAGFRYLVLLDPRLTGDFLAKKTKIVCQADPSEFWPIDKRKRKPIARAVQWTTELSKPKQVGRPLTLEDGLTLLLYHGNALGSIELKGSTNKYGCFPCIREPNPPYVLDSQLGSNPTSCNTGYAVPVAAK